MKVRLCANYSPARPDTLIRRWANRVELPPGDGCWVWRGAKMGKMGYGTMGAGRTAHRYAYEVFVGPVPVGLELDHLCRNPACVNPEHLEPVTHTENVRRGALVIDAFKNTHCKRGHELVGRNAMWKVGRSGRRKRACRQCANLAWTNYYKRRKQGAAA